jgi:putative ABC transport system substrate-binding protein
MEVEVLGRLAMQVGNVTGLVFPLTDLNARRLELLKEALPATARAAVLINPANPTMAPLMREAEPVAQRLGIALQAFAVERAGQLSPTMDAVARGSDSLLIMEDTFLETQASELAALAAARRLPALGFHRRFAEAGGLMAYGVDQRAPVQ